MRKAEEVLSKSKLASNQVEYSLMERRIETGLLHYCEQKRIAVLPYRPIAHGALANPVKKLKLVMDEISQKHNGISPLESNCTSFPLQKYLGRFCSTRYLDGRGTRVCKKTVLGGGR